MQQTKKVVQYVNKVGEKFYARKKFIPFVLNPSLYSLVGAKVPGCESSTPGTFAPGSEWSWERKVQFPVNDDS